MQSVEANDQEAVERLKLGMILWTEKLTEVGEMSDQQVVSWS